MRNRSIQAGLTSLTSELPIPDSSLLDISGASNDNLALSDGPRTDRLRDAKATFDGVNVYTSENTSDEVHHYTLSDVEDISSFTFVSTLNTGSSSDPFGASISQDGINLYVSCDGGSVSQSIQHWQMSTANDLSTASLITTYSVGVDIRGAQINFDGTAIYYTDNTNNRIRKLNLSVPFSLASGVTLDPNFRSVSSGKSGIWVAQDEQSFCVTDAATDNVEQYIMTTPTDLSTAPASPNFTYTNGNMNNIQDVFISYDLAKMYVPNRNAPAQVNQYSTNY